MALWDEVRRAAKEAAGSSKTLRDAMDDVRRAAKTKQAEPPTITVDPYGGTALVSSRSGVVALGRALLLLVVSVAALGLSWLAAALLGFYLLLQRMMGLRIKVEAPR